MCQISALLPLVSGGREIINILTAFVSLSQEKKTKLNKQAKHFRQEIHFFTNIFSPLI